MPPANKLIVLNAIVEDEPQEYPADIAIIFNGEIDVREWFKEFKKKPRRTLNDTSYTIEIICRNGTRLSLHECHPIQVLKGVDQVALIRFKYFTRKLRTRWFTV